jgi:type IV pilus assembly protein PilA
MPMVRKTSYIKNGTGGETGFSLVEILLVVMVILIIAAIAIPNLVQGRMRANEASAVASMQTIHTAEILYFNTYPDVGFSSSLANLGSNGTDCEKQKPTSKNACLIMDDVLTSGLKSGYVFSIVGDGNQPTAAYVASATPASGVSGRCTMAANQTGEMRFFTPGASINLGARSVGSGGSGCGL